MSATQEQLEKWFSKQRFRKFLQYTSNDVVQAEQLYIDNIMLSEALYPVLSVFEVSFRNSVHQQLSYFYDRDDWYEAWRNSYDDLSKLVKRIDEAIAEIKKRDEEVNTGKVIAEMSLGFWVSMFNVSYERILWKPLRLCFKNLSKSRRKRHPVSANLNKIRKLRNRVYHYEPICWNQDTLKQGYDIIITTLGWLDTDLPKWVDEIDEFETVLNKVQNNT